MKDMIQKFIKRVQEDLGNEYDVRTDYSGRFMFGKTCLGITYPKGVETEILFKLRDIVEEFDDTKDREFLLNCLYNRSTDNMGLDMIMYFRQISVE